MCRLAVSRVNVLFVVEQNLLCHDSLQHSVTRNGEKKIEDFIFAFQCSKRSKVAAVRSPVYSCVQILLVPRRLVLMNK